MKRLLILLIFIGVLVMFKSINAIIQDSIGNIIYRGNVVTGIVATDNGDKSYDVFISESEKAYPHIFTLSANPVLAVGDKVRILYKNGCKELPIILPPTTVTIIRQYALICASPNSTQLFDIDGILLNQISNAGWGYGQCGLCLDTSGNIYVEENTTMIKKYDKDFNLLITKNIESGSNWIEGINMGPDGYLYTLEGIASGFDIKKRYTSTLLIKEIIPITSDVFADYSSPICLDSNGYFYVYNAGLKYIQKYNNSGILIAQRDITAQEGLGNAYAGCGVLGNFVYFVHNTNEIFYLSLDLVALFDWNLPNDVAYSLTIADNSIILSGWDGTIPTTAKYDSNRNLVWSKILTGVDYAYKAGGYNF
jgi:hypothetical protein